MRTGYTENTSGQNCSDPKLPNRQIYHNRPMKQYLFDGAIIRDEEGNPQKDKRGEVVQEPPCFIIERKDNKPTLKEVNAVREHFGLERLFDNINYPLDSDLSGSHGSHMIVWNGKKFCIVPFNESLKSLPKGSEDDRKELLQSNLLEL